MQSPEQPAAGGRASGAELALPFIIVAVVLVLDQWTKRLVESRIPLNTSWAPFPEFANLFQFTHVANTGAAFGIFQGGGIVFTILALVVVGAIVYFNFTLPAGNVLIRVALGLMLGGAIGNNLIDRIRLGHVTDFVDIGPWYIFNVADLALTSGIILMAYAILIYEPRRARAAARARQASAPESIAHDGDSAPG
jgi:signal peptidase II